MTKTHGGLERNLQMPVTLPVGAGRPVSEYAFQNSLKHKGFDDTSTRENPQSKGGCQGDICPIGIFLLIFAHLTTLSFGISPYILSQ